MNGRERFFAVFEGRLPDRVPVMEMIVDERVARELSGCADYYDFFEKVGCYDLVVCHAGVVYPGEPDWIDREKKIFRDKWGTVQQHTNQFLPHSVGGPLIRQLSDLDRYAPPDPGDQSILGALGRVADRYGRDRAIGFLGEDVFAVTQYLLGGPAEALVALKLEPELVRSVAAVAEAYHTELYRNALRMGADVIILGDDYGTSRAPMMSPADFNEFFLPGILRIVRAVHALGGKVIKHTDGNVWPLLEGLIEAGVDAVGPLQHECDMRLDEVKDRYPDVVVVGNVPVDILIRGSREEVRLATAECIRRCSPGGRHILSSGNSITSDVPPKNLLAMLETAHDSGRYPIQC